MRSRRHSPIRGAGLYALLGLAASACGGEQTSAAEGDASSESGGPDEASEADTGEGISESEDSSESEESETDGGTKFDLAPIADLEEPPPPPMIPENCTEAESSDTSVGCLFFTVDLDSNVDSTQFAVAISNVQDVWNAEVTVERKVAGQWEVVEGPVIVPALGLYEFLLDDFHIEGTGINVGGAYRVSSSHPIIAYQFNPIDGDSSYLSDASMLYPVPAWDEHNQVVNWADSSEMANPFVSFAAAHDQTAVTFTPSVATKAGDGIPATEAGVPIVIELDEGDVATINPVDPHADLSGTVLSSDPEHPIALFSGHGCANIPAEACCCDHLEEQLSGVHRWGKRFIAAHMPLRDKLVPEATLWQLYASKDGTTVSLDAAPGVVGLPGSSLELDAGEVVNLFVSAPMGTAADFEITADEPIAVLSYMLSAEVLSPALDNFGDPAMLQFPPIEQFLSRYVVLVPGTWDADVLILIRPAGAILTLDDQLEIPDFHFEPVGDGEWEVARYDIWDGVHVLEAGGEPFGVMVVGWDYFDSYAYLGGTATSKINIEG